MTGSYIPRVKIVCTLGPASSTEETLIGLVEAGMNVARLNFSHGTHEQHEETIAMVRRVADSLASPAPSIGGRTLSLSPKVKTVRVTSRSPMTISLRMSTKATGY